MVRTFALTEDATADLETAVSFLAERSEALALRTAEAQEDAFLMLSQHPRIGHRYLGGIEIDDVRFWTAAGYQIAYLPERSPIPIVAALYGARDAEAIIPTRVERL